MAERPTFSPFWHRVRTMKPRLRSHVQITRQHYRGRRWHVVHDPATNNFYRLNPIAHEFVCLLDGHRSVEEVWKLTLARHGDAAPTQHEVIQLISQLYNSNLLSADTSPETEQLLRRGRERFKKKAASQAIGIMYFRMRLFNPDRILAWIEPILRPVLNKWGLAFWLAWMVAGLYVVVLNFEGLTSNVENVMNPKNWAWLIVVFIVTKAIHETGHGVICKRFKGQVPEFGMMLLVLFPAPYVDASAAWAMSSKWQRMAIGAGGMIFELFIATGAVFVWLATDGTDSLVHQLAYNVIFTASISTVLFNANPLMRFDGYYILSDLIEVPNLMQRSMNMLKFLFQKNMYRLKQATPPTGVRSEQIILVGYGMCALVWRIFLFFSITLLVMGKFFAIGLILAVWTGAAWFIMPVGKFVHWLAANSMLAEHRTRAVATTFAAIALVLFAIGLVPVPDHRRATGVVESTNHTGVFFGTDGFVIEAHVRPGQFVKKGDPIVTCSNMDLETELRRQVAELERFRSLDRQMTQQSPAAAEITRSQIVNQIARIKLLQERVDQLIVRAPHDGAIVGPDPAWLVGAFAKRGQGLCEVVDTSQIRIAATMSTASAAPLIELGKGRFEVELRLVSDTDTVLHGGDVRLIEVGQERLPHAALGYLGGGDVATEVGDQSGVVAKSKQFIAYIMPKDGEDQWTAAPGQRVWLRFNLPSKPLLSQWIDRLHKLVQGRVKL